MAAFVELLGQHPTDGKDVVPNHSTFSKNRHGRLRESGTFRWVFYKVVRACMAGGLVKGKGFAVDASIIEAEAGSKLGMPGDEPHVWQNPAHCKRAVREYLEGLDNPALSVTVPPIIGRPHPVGRPSLPIRQTI